jgi:Domain of unknown function (DUF4845)
MSTPSTQRGATFLGWLGILGLIGFFSLLALRLAPLYLENYKVTATLESLLQEPYITKKQPLEIRQLIDKRLYINDVRHVKAKDFKIEPKGGRTTIGIDYEVKRPFIGNVGLFVNFSESIEIVAN